MSWLQKIGIAGLARAQGTLRPTMMARVRLASAPFQHDLQQARSSYASLNTGMDIGFMSAVAIYLIR